MKIYQLIDTRNNTKVLETYSDSLKDVKEFWKETIEFYSDVVKLKIKEVGRAFYNKDCSLTKAYYNDLNDNADLVKGMSDSMLKKLLALDFSNTNTNFFMIERGLLKECREELTEKGEIIRKTFLR